MTILKREHYLRFMGIDFLHGDRSDIRKVVRASAVDAYSYLVTPNVDDLVKTLGGFLPPRQSDAFLLADYKLCDSKVLEFLSRLVGKRLLQYPGSDLVRDLLLDASFISLTIAVIGPSPSEFAKIEQLYPDRHFVFIDAPIPLTPDTDVWRRCVDELSTAKWSIALICLPLPRQQLVAEGLRLNGRKHGIAMCVGASIDFLSGKQRRAPAWMQTVGLEWAYRLCTNPRRMWRRYLLDGPNILHLFFTREFFPHIFRYLRITK